MRFDRKLLFVVPIALVLGCYWHFPKYSKSEETLMGICWMGNAAIYPKGGVGNAECDDPQVLRWDKNPKLVYFDSRNGYAKSFESAVRFWNKEIPNSFQITESMGKADIIVTWGSVTGGAAGSTFHILSSDGSITAYVQINLPGNIREVYLRIAHELGHAAWGLGHDRRGSGSIMEKAAGWGEKNRLKVWHLTKADKEAIKSLDY